MIFRTKLVAIAILVATASYSGFALHIKSADAVDPSIASSEIVSYRLMRWKTTHSDGPFQTRKLVKTLKKLRCEVKVDSHGGHTDVNYRCPKWQKLALKNHDAAHQWESWLKKYGFETRHVH